MHDADIQILANHFKGSRLAKFLASVQVIRESVAARGWVRPRGRDRAMKGFNGGLASAKALPWPGPTMYDDPRREALFACHMALSGGMLLRAEHLAAMTDDDLVLLAPKTPLAVTRAWLRLKADLRPIVGDLDASRPLPVYTEIGLSPRVTATLRDAALDLDLTTRRLCPLGERWVQVVGKDGQVVRDRDGLPKTVKVYFADWPEGTVFGASRFAHADCEACGKTIPSRLVVPLLVSDQAGRTLGFYFGRDCAANILGIKDAGLADTRAAE